MSQPVKEVSRVLPARKRIALVAHDGKKQELMDWASRWKDTLTGAPADRHRDHGRPSQPHPGTGRGRVDERSAGR